MNVQDFLQHHGMARNPFAEEEAQTDPVFKDHCIHNTYHPTWDKVFGDPREPSTSIVFGEKGAGKTAMRLQIAGQIEAFNRENPQQKIALIHYDDFNPFLDRFASHFAARKKPEKILDRFRLWDHMDAILSIGTTGLVDRLLSSDFDNRQVILDVGSQHAAELDRHQSRDLLLLASLYDTSSAESRLGRWHRLRRSSNYFAPAAFWDSALGVGWSLCIGIGLFILYVNQVITRLDPLWLYLLIFAAGWLPKLWRTVSGWWRAKKVVAQIRTGRGTVSDLRKLLAWFAPRDLASQPLPTFARTDDRYELFHKFSRVLAAMGYSGIVIGVDRVDEPHLINGATKRMRALVWPLLDNKFLKQPKIGFKLMLPAELKPYIDREEPDFHQRARLDKQNVIPSFAWTGEALLDLTEARIIACSIDTRQPSLRNLIDDQVSDHRLLEAMRTLRVPRHLFKFLYRLLVSHCNAYTKSEPSWQISSERFEAELAEYLRDREKMASQQES